MTIEAKIIADSISPAGIRLTTMQLRYPRFIHAEFMTHRVFSRNASSSRAIPVERMIEDLRRDPAMPIYWGSNKPGMQAGTELEEFEKEECFLSWLAARDKMIVLSKLMISYGLHKQIANRILEPWAHINVVVTATEWDNFFELRCHSDAQPEMRALAEAMQEAMRLSVPDKLQSGEWHLPYTNEEDRENIRKLCDIPGIPGEVSEGEIIGGLQRISVARCARVSYLTHDGRKTTIEEDLALYDRLVGSVPLHASPTEHQATPDTKYRSHREEKWNFPEKHGNFSGWIQNRKLIESKMR